MFDGDTADPKTLAAQITKIKQRFGLTRIAVVGDRGMLTSARIYETGWAVRHLWSCPGQSSPDVRLLRPGH